MIKTIFILANIGIFLAYISIAFRRIVHVKAILSQTRWWGVIFFVTCGLTHLFMAGMTYWSVHWHDILPWWFVANHIIQFFAAWFFLQNTKVENEMKGNKDISFGSMEEKSIREELNETKAMFESVKKHQKALRAVIEKQDPKFKANMIKALADEMFGTEEEMN